MSKLVKTRNIQNPDDMYEMLISAHEGKTKEQSDAFNARLILTLMNHIGDAEVFTEALQVAEDI